jgi:2-oxoglutarate ferredoxin oxidoreductase subunit gamma
MEQQRREIRIAGFGGQGVVLSGIVLARAGMLDGRHVVQNQSYGAEARGGGARAEVILADDPILYTDVLHPDVMVVMSQLACDKYGADLTAKGQLILENELVSEVPLALQDRASGAPFTQLAQDRFGRAIVANMLALGYCVGCTEVVARNSLEQAVEELVPAGTAELNLAALVAGWELATVCQT